MRCIVHEIYKSFDCNLSLETRGVFLDISKAFDRVWHNGLLFKLRSNGIEGPLFKLLENYLHNRKQRVVLNGQTSTWANINADVPQGSVLGPLIFLMYINDLPDGLQSNVKLFADDTSVFSVVNDINDSCSHLNEHKFRHNFRDTLNLFCSYNLEPETLTHFLLHCPHHNIHRITLLDSVFAIDESISHLSDANLVNLLLHENPKQYSNEENTSILNFTISFLKSSGRFDIALY